MQKWVCFLVLFLVGCAPFGNTVLTGFQTKKECLPGMKLGREIFGTAWCSPSCGDCLQQFCPPGTGRNYVGDCSCWEREWNTPKQVACRNKNGLVTHCVPDAKMCSDVKSHFDILTGKCEEAYVLAVNKKSCITENDCQKNKRWLWYPTEKKCGCNVAYTEKNGECVAEQIDVQSCDRLHNEINSIVDAWKKKGKVSNSAGEFYDHLAKKNPWWSSSAFTRPRAYLTLGNDGLYLEEGVKPPLRTGYEVKLYNKFKQFLTTRSSTERLTIPKLFEMGLEASKEDNQVNLQIAAMTIHNLIRFFARSQLLILEGPQGQATRPGDYGHPPSDPMYPIYRELQGFESTEGKTLSEILGIKKFPKGHPEAGQLSNKEYGGRLFDFETGAFPVYRSAWNAETNGGHHYYFWVGMAGKLGGPHGLTRLGKWGEIIVGKVIAGEWEWEKTKDRLKRGFYQTSRGLDCAAEIASNL